MSRRVWLMTFLFIFASCSTLNKNLIKKGSHRITGGVYEDERWDDELEFERISWFKELTMYFDLMATQINEGSPFYRWFSDFERESLDKCVESYIIVTYAWNPIRISRTDFFTNLAKQGWSKVYIPDFQKHIRMHPHFSRLNITQYKVHALCRESISAKKELTLRFPGFNETTM